jgi:hypothetical protein
VDKNQVLAERRLWMEREGVPGRREVALQIGYPNWSKGGDRAICPIAIEGLFALPPARGRDFFDALVQAVRTLRQHCRKPPEGVRFFYFEEPPCDRQPYQGEPLDEEESAAGMREFLARYRKDWPVLVERKILMQRRGSEERSEVILQIGEPYWVARHNVEMAACPIALKSEGVEWVDHYDGDDLFEALSNAARQMNQMFVRSRRSVSFFWPDGKPYHGDYPVLFPRRSRKRDPRGIAGNWQVLAERSLLMERDGVTGRTQIAIRIGRPYWTEEGKWAACPLAISGLHGNLGPMPGRDLYEALIAALEFFDRYGRKTDSASNFFWPDDRRYFWPDGTPYEGEPLYLEPAPEPDSSRR